MALTAEKLAQHKYMLHSYTFAEHVSQGRWQPYKWCVATMGYFEKELLKGNFRGIATMPPQHGKSLSMSWLAAWLLALNPSLRLGWGTYSDARALYWGSMIRSVFVENPWLGVILRKDTKRMNEWRTVEGGGLKSVGVGGSLTGYPVDIMFLDDLIKDYADAYSPVIRETIRNWFDSVVYFRIQPGGSILADGTRWHMADILGYFINEHADKWHVINLPALAEENDAIGRVLGEALCPERYDREALLRIKEATPEPIWTSMFQCRPSPDGGAIIKRDWIKRYHPSELPAREDDSCISLDCTFKESGTSFVAAHVWQRTSANFYLVDRRHARMSYVETKIMFRALCNQHKNVRKKYVEEAANGLALMSDLKDEISGIIGVKVHESKMARFVSVSPYFQAGNVWIPYGKEYDELIEELVTFPSAPNDDDCDACSMALTQMHYASYDTNFSLGGGSTGADLGHRESPWRFS